MRLVRSGLAGALLATAFTSGGADAASARLISADGRTLVVGSVISVGELVGGVCEFPGKPVPIRLTPGYSVRLTTRADHDCRRVVTGITTSKGAVTLDQDAPMRRPKHDAAVLLGAAGGHVPGIGSQAAVADVVGAVADAAGSADSTVVYAVGLYLRIVDAAGVQQYEDASMFQFAVDYARETVGGFVYSGGYCHGGIAANVLGGWDPLTDVRNCYYKLLSGGPKQLEYRSGGYFRKGWTVAGAGVQLDERHLNEEFTASADSIWHECYSGGAMPPGWSDECMADVR